MLTTLQSTRDIISLHENTGQTISLQEENTGQSSSIILVIFVKTILIRLYKYAQMVHRFRPMAQN